MYRVTHLVGNLGWVDLDLGSSPGCMVASSVLGSDCVAAQNVDYGTARPAHSEERGKIGKVTPCFCLWFSQFIQHFRS